MEKEYTIKLTLFAKDSETEENSEKHQKKLLANAEKLCKHTAENWEYFKDNKCEFKIINHNPPYLKCSLTGVPTQPLKEWVSWVEFTIMDKGTHEQFDEAQLWNRKDRYVYISIYFNEKDFWKENSVVPQEPAVE